MTAQWIGRVGKWLGIAGLLGVAAGGVLIVRDERQRRAYTPDEVRQRLHERAAQVGPRTEPRHSAASNSQGRTIAMAELPNREVPEENR